MSPAGFLPTVFQTESLAYQSGDIATAVINIFSYQLSDVNGFAYALTNDGGSTWETYTELDTTHTFSSSGDDLRLRIVGNPGESISLKDSEENSKPIVVKYTYA